MAALPTLMLKAIIQLERLTFERLGVGDNDVNRFGVSDGVEHIKKSKKTSKSWNLAKLRKKSPKSGNSTNFYTTEAKPKFPTPNVRTIFNHLRLVFIEVTILWNFNPKYDIKIETDALGYAIDEVLS